MDHIIKEQIQLFYADEDLIEGEVSGCHAG
jgi:hypothetical protein